MVLLSWPANGGGPDHQTSLSPAGRRCRASGMLSTRGQQPCLPSGSARTEAEPSFAMNTPLERTGGYFSAELRDSRAPWIKPPSPFITLSRESCAGGSGLAQLLVRRLNGAGASAAGWTIFGGNVINR